MNKWFLPFFFLLAFQAQSHEISEVSNFGSNPGNLKMKVSLESKNKGANPLVVLLHGCSQEAQSYAKDTGWLKLSKKYHFNLLMPEQKKSNNPYKCFNWFNPFDSTRDFGEIKSIVQMIGKIKQLTKIDPHKIFVTGLSAGGSMTAVALANYPELFKAGAPVAGVPFGCAHSSPAAFWCMDGFIQRTPGLWAFQVKIMTGYQGVWPRISIWQGEADKTVHMTNAQEMVKQWTELHQLSQIPTEEKQVEGHDYFSYQDQSKTKQVELYIISNQGHGQAIAPGDNADQCGKEAPYILDSGICASYHIGKFFELF